MKDCLKPNIVAVGVYIPGFSFTRVFNSLFKYLSEYYTIHWLGLAYNGEPVQKENYFLHPCKVAVGDLYGGYAAVSLAKECDAKAILILNDFFILQTYSYAFEQLKSSSIKLIAYVPFDGMITEFEMMEECFFLDKLVVFHRRILEEVENAFQKFIEVHPDEKFNVPNLSFRYHGVDVEKFKRTTSLEQRVALKEKIFNVPDVSESVFILNANRFSHRKNLEATISAFNKALPFFQKSTYLCLHSPDLVHEDKIVLDKLVAENNSHQKIILNPLGESYVEDRALLELYQACEIGVNTSFGEGWGMISFEHAACGAVQIVPSHSASGHLWKDAGILIPNDKPVKLVFNPFLMFSVDVEELSRQFIQLVNDEIYFTEQSEKCYVKSQLPEFDWQNIAEGWREIID